MFRVLYVDDDRDLRDLAEMSLSADPEIDALTAPDGSTALRMIREGSIDLAIVDLRMPDMGGLDLVGRLARDPGASPGARVLVTTAGATAADTDRMIAAGAVGLLRKPFDPLDLPRIVRHLLRPEAATPGDTASADAALGLLR